MGLGPWQLDIPPVGQDPCIEDMSSLLPQLSYILVQLEGPRTLSLQWQSPHSQTALVLSISPLSPEEMNVFLTQDSQRAANMGYKKVEDRLEMTIDLTYKEDTLLREEELMQLLGLNREDLKSFVKESLQEIDHKTKDLAKEFHLGNWPEVHRISHSLKGTAMNLGLDRLRSRAYGVEKKAKAQNLDEQELKELLDFSKKMVLQLSENSFPRSVPN